MASVLDTLSIGGIGDVIAPDTCGPITQANTTSNSSRGRSPPMTMPTGRYCSTPCLSSAKSTSEHHHHEQEQHGDGADIDYDQDHRQELGAHEHKQTCGIDEGEDEKQHRMHRIARRNDHGGAGDADAGKEIEDSDWTIISIHRYERRQRKVLGNLTLPAVAVGEQPVCRSKAPRASRWRIRNSGPRRWRRPGRPPGTARNRCI